MLNSVLIASEHHPYWSKGIMIVLFGHPFHYTNNEKYVKLDANMVIEYNCPTY